MSYNSLVNRDDVADVLNFWFGDRAQWRDGKEDSTKFKMWFQDGRKWDDTIRERFGSLWHQAKQGELDAWSKDSVLGTLALVIVLDQFSRNLGRGSGAAFEQDAKARALVMEVLKERQDHELEPIERVFMYMPLEHHEDLESQRLCEQLFEELTQSVTAPEDKKRYKGFKQFATKHLDIIKEFGRFPHRNELLGREPTPEEQAYLESGGATFGQSSKTSS